MKKLNSTINNFFAMLLLVVVVASCDQKTDPADSITTDDYPKVTITHDLDQETYTEGDTVNFEMTMDKPTDQSFPFKLMVEGGDATDTDLADNSVTYPANKVDTVEINAVFKQDDIPEKDESLSWKLGIDDIGVRKLVHPDSEFPSGDVTIKNHNNEDGITVAFGWENPKDEFDMLAAYYQGTSYKDYLIDGGGNNPERIVDDSGDQYTYFYSVTPGLDDDDNYIVNQNKINYRLAVGYPDQSVEISTYSFSFDKDNVAFTDPDGNDLDTSALGADVVRLLKVESTATGSGPNDFDVTFLNKDDSGN